MNAVVICPMNPNVNQAMCVNLAIMNQLEIPWNPTALSASVAIFLWFSYGFPMDFLTVRAVATVSQVAFLQRMIQLHHLPEASKDGTIAVVDGKIFTGPLTYFMVKTIFSYRFSQPTMVFGIDFPFNQSNDRCEVDSTFVDD